MVDDPDGDDDLECRICRNEAEADRALYIPCRCRGSIRYCHEDCLMQWLEHSGNDRCELCGVKFEFTPLYADGAPKTVPALALLDAGLRHVVLKTVPFLVRVLVSAALWLVVAPLTTSMIYRAWIHRPSELPMSLFSCRLWEELASGLVIVASVVVSFLSLLSFTDYMRVRWEVLENNNNIIMDNNNQHHHGHRRREAAAFAPPPPVVVAPAQPPPVVVNNPGAPPAPQGTPVEPLLRQPLDDDFEDEDSDDDQSLPGLVEGDSTDEEEEEDDEEEEEEEPPVIVRGPMPEAVEEDDDDDDEEEEEEDIELHIAMDELLGLRGPIVNVTRNVSWLIVFNAAYLGIFAFVPFFVGSVAWRMAVRDSAAVRVAKHAAYSAYTAVSVVVSPSKATRHLARVAASRHLSLTSLFSAGEKYARSSLVALAAPLASNMIFGGDNATSTVAAMAGEGEVIIVNGRTIKDDNAPLPNYRAGVFLANKKRLLALSLGRLAQVGWSWPAAFLDRLRKRRGAGATPKPTAEEEKPSPASEEEKAPAAAAGEKKEAVPPTLRFEDLATIGAGYVALGASACVWRAALRSAPRWLRRRASPRALRRAERALDAAAAAAKVACLLTLKMALLPTILGAGLDASLSPPLLGADNNPALFFFLSRTKKKGLKFVNYYYNQDTSKKLASQIISLATAGPFSTSSYYYDYYYGASSSSNTTYSSFSPSTTIIATPTLEEAAAEDEEQQQLDQHKVEAADHLQEEPLLIFSEEEEEEEDEALLNYDKRAPLSYPVAKGFAGSSASPEAVAWAIITATTNLTQEKSSNVSAPVSSSYNIDGADEKTQESSISSEEEVEDVAADVEEEDEAIGVADLARRLGGGDLSAALARWVIGITFMLVVTVAVLQLREVLHPAVFAHLVRPHEPQPDLLAALLAEPATNHAWRLLTSLAIYAGLLAIFVAVPAACLAPPLRQLGLVPLRPTLRYLAPKLQIPLELLFFHVALLTLLERMKLRIGDAQRLWLECISKKLGIAEYLMPRPGPPVNNDDNLAPEAALRAALGAGRIPVVHMVAAPADRWAWAEELPSARERGLLPRVRPRTLLGPRCAALVAASWLLTLCVTLGVALAPLLLGRAALALLDVREPHDPFALALGWLILLFALGPTLDGGPPPPTPAEQQQRQPAPVQQQANAAAAAPPPRRRRPQEEEDEAALPRRRRRRRGAVFDDDEEEEEEEYEHEAFNPLLREEEDDDEEQEEEEAPRLDYFGIARRRRQQPPKGARRGDDDVPDDYAAAAAIAARQERTARRRRRVARRPPLVRWKRLAFWCMWLVVIPIWLGVAYDILFVASLGEWAEWRPLGFSSHKQQHTQLHLQEVCTLSAETPTAQTIFGDSDSEAAASRPECTRRSSDEPPEPSSWRRWISSWFSLLPLMLPPLDWARDWLLGLVLLHLATLAAARSAETGRMADSWALTALCARKILQESLVALKRGGARKQRRIRRFEVDYGALMERLAMPALETVVFPALHIFILVLFCVLLDEYRPHEMKLPRFLVESQFASSVFKAASSDEVKIVYDDAEPFAFGAKLLLFYRCTVVGVFGAAALSYLVDPLRGWIDSAHRSVRDARYLVGLRLMNYVENNDRQTNTAPAPA